MLIVCPGCDTKYNIKDELVPPQGAQLKCSKCQKIIYIKKEEVTKEIPVQQKSVAHETPFSDFEDRPTVLSPSSLGLSDNWLEQQKMNNSQEKKMTFKEDEVKLNEPKINVPKINTQKVIKAEVPFDDIFKNFNDTLQEDNDDILNEDISNIMREEDTSNFQANETSSKSGEYSSKSDKYIKSPNFLSKTSEKGPSFSEVFNDFSDEVEDNEEEILPDEDVIKPTPVIIKPAVKKIQEDTDTTEMSLFEMDKLREKLKDGLIDDDFNKENIKDAEIFKDDLKPAAKIFVKVQEGPSYEFQSENDITEWLKKRNDLTGVSYSLDNKTFEPILLHPVFSKLKKESVESAENKIPIPNTTENNQDTNQPVIKPQKSIWGLVAAVLFVIIVLLTAYVLHLAEVVNISFLEPLTPKKQIIVKTIEPDESVKVKFKKNTTDEIKTDVKVDEVKKDETKTDVKVDETKKDETKTDVKVDETKKDETKTDVKVDETKKDEVKSGEIKKIEAKDKREFYRQARTALKEENFEKAKELFLTLAYNYPEEAEPYGALGVILKKLKDNANGTLFAKAFKQINASEPNTNVTKELIEKLLKK